MFGMKRWRRARKKLLKDEEDFKKRKIIVYPVNIEKPKTVESLIESLKRFNTKQRIYIMVEEPCCLGDRYEKGWVGEIYQSGDRVVITIKM